MVSQWDDDVPLEGPFRRLDQSTLVVGCAIALCYPILVYVTLSPMFPWPVNLLLGGCTLLLVGYLLTIPRIALGAFGGWAFLSSVWFLVDGSIAPLSPVALAAQAGFWIPFGYAVGVWWALKQ